MNKWLVKEDVTFGKVTFKKGEKVWFNGALYPGGHKAVMRITSADKCVDIEDPEGFNMDPFVSVGED